MFALLGSVTKIETEAGVTDDDRLAATNAAFALVRIPLAATHTHESAKSRACKPSCLSLTTILSSTASSPPPPFTATQGFGGNLPKLFGADLERRGDGHSYCVQYVTQHVSLVL